MVKPLFFFFFFFLKHVSIVALSVNGMPLKIQHPQKMSLTTKDVSSASIIVPHKLFSQLLAALSFGKADFWWNQRWVWEHVFTFCGSEPPTLQWNRPRWGVKSYEMPIIISMSTSRQWLSFLSFFLTTSTWSDLFHGNNKVYCTVGLRLSGVLSYWPPEK